MPSRTRAPVRIVIVQPEALFRDTLRSALGQAAGIVVAGVFVDGDELLRGAADLAPHVAVLDLDAGCHNGVGLALRLKRANPDLGIVLLINSRDIGVLSALPNEALLEWCYVVNKSTVGVTALLRAIQVTHARLLNLGDIVPVRIVPDQRPSPALPDLTARQREILGLLVQGLTNKAIAQTLRLKEKTIENQLATVYGKFHLEGDRTLVHPRVWAALYFSQATRAEEASVARASEREERLGRRR
jgi:DNA-binding NarL/FixJ family response regulator